ncbi:glycoside hydrolase family 38 C-terminal domain-containing protein [Bacillus sp. KH172YL63]|uniref:glycoside hydrolase family 38 N-terminal domain-containing protein n=1 Tax=Bacillus sp. KH172YL63 TaxID=2709784 RepID=UPI0013E4CFCC|nr:glycoside hydrolase family 38 C-terminal domain-containing protein [Bacillus sp. KH172YL63]BCB05846.1 alpha-mannosidase [Bacillus sp. KH172YL63]
MKKRVYVVPHSHWDREWYFTIEDSNILLAENLDHLINVLETDGDYTGYVFDAQASIVEEYVKVRPENRDRLGQLVEEKKLFIGPWYTQTDSLLVNKESIIRNLLYGTKISKSYGHSMNCGYLPDIFGQNQYLPSIFQGFGIDNSVLQRGIYTDQLKGDVNFKWKSPDGVTVHANNLYFGYGPGKFLEASEEYKEERLYPILEKLADLNQNSDHLLLPAGGDQVLVREHFPETIKKLNEGSEEYEFVLSDYETFMQDAWENSDKFTNIIEGELTATQKSRIHNTIRSQRYDIKKLNYEVEHKILNVLEPLAVIAQSAGLRYPQAWLDGMWKELFDVHAHDSIGGCNSDDTNSAIVQRLEKVDRMADGLLNILKKQMTEAISHKLGTDSIFVFFNTDAAVFSGTVEAVLFTKSRHFKLKKLSGETVNMEAVDQEYISGGKKIVVTAEGEKQVEVPGYYRTVIMAELNEVSGLGYEAYIVEETSDPMGKVEESRNPSIENEHVKVEFIEGNVTLTEKHNGTKITDLIRFEDVGDAGDSYDFSPLEGDQPLWLEGGELVSVDTGALSQKIVMKHERFVPGNLTERQSGTNSEPLVILTTIELRKNERLVRMKHTIENKVEDHRVRVMLNTGAGQPETTFADQGFGLIERSVDNPYMKDWKGNGFAEAPVPIYSLENFAGVCGEAHTFAAITRGMKEYEVMGDTGELALTLFRSVGLLGKDDLAWRPGRASGINNKVVYTPDAQMKQKMTFEYALYAGPVEPAGIFNITDRYIGRHAGYQKQSLNTFEERLERFEIPYPLKEMEGAATFVQIDHPSIFMSTCKRAYDDSSVVIRLFNPTESVQTCTVQHGFEEISITNLAEEWQQEAGSEIDILPKSHLTIKLS